MGNGLLIVTLGFSTIFAGYVFHFNVQQNNASKIINTELEHMLAKNTLESLANVSIAKAYQGLSVPDTATFADVTYRTNMIDVTGDSINTVEKDSIVVIAEYNGLADSSWVVMMNPSYSYYQYFHNDAWPILFFNYSTGDTAKGPIHCNNQLTGISLNPVFFGKVSSANNNPVGLLGAIYHSGLELGTKQISLVGATITPIQTQALATGRVFGNPDTLHLTFHADGTYDYRQGLAIGNENVTATNGLIISTDVTRPVVIHAGTLNGSVTVIGTDVYARGSTTYAGTDDYLGIVAAHNFGIWYPTGTFSINLEAAIIALNRFILENDNGLIVSALTPFDFDFNGSLAIKEDRCYGLYVLLGSQILIFTRTLNYDKRLRTNTPPYFPRTTRREILARKN